jgi:hypothetical protein
MIKFFLAQAKFKSIRRPPSATVTGLEICRDGPIETSRILTKKETQLPSRQMSDF